MHASLAYVNGAGIAEGEDLCLLNTLLSSSSNPTERNSQDERPDEERESPDPASQPDSFKNDPPDPKNPNEVREKFLDKINR